MTKAVKLFAIAIAVLVLGGCSLPGAVKIKTDDSGVDVKAPGIDVKTSDDGVEVKTPGVDVTTGDGIDVELRGNKADGPEGAGLLEKRNVVLVMDASGSMNSMLNGRTKMSIAKESASMLVDKTKNDVNLGVVAYGHIGGNAQDQKEESCNGIEEIYYFGPVNSGVVKSKIAALPAKGWTPIAESLKKAKMILSKQSGEKREVLLISDGEETCGGNPIAVAKEICAAGMRVDVIGFNVSGASEAQLKNISIGGCGAYASVDSYEDFNVIIKGDGLHVQSPGTMIDIQAGGIKVDTVDAMVTAGDDDVSVEADGVDVKAGDGGASVSIPNVPDVKY